MRTLRNFEDRQHVMQLCYNSVVVHQIAHVGASPGRNIKLFGREIVSEEFQPTLSRVPKRTDNLLSHHRALRSIAR